MALVYKMNIYFVILFCFAISHGFPYKIKDPRILYGEQENDSINHNNKVDIELVLPRLSEITVVNKTEDLVHSLISGSNNTDKPLEREPRFIRNSGIVSAAAIAAKSIFRARPFGAFLSLLPFFNVRKVITISPDATAVIVPGISRKIHGRLIFFNRDNGVHIVGEIRGLTPGSHGIHVHKERDLHNFCSAAGSHFNPTASSHGSPSATIRHVGDLGNIVARPNGVARVDIFDRLISLNPSSANYIGNRAIVIHANEDDLGLGGTNDASSLDSGNAGPRVGCGLIVKEFTRHY